MRVEGQLVFNDRTLMLDAALAGFGLAYLPEDHARRRIWPRGGWCACSPTGARRFAGYHLYYPSRRQPTPAFAAAGGGAALPQVRTPSPIAEFPSRPA